MKLSGKVAIVTGASRGIGRAIALKLAREGADVVIAAKTVEPDPRLPGTIHDVAREVEALGRRALAIQTNVRQEADIERMVEETLKTFGRVDILVNNAGALWWYPVLETPAKRFDLVMDVNVRAAFLSARAVLPIMIKQQHGKVISLTTVYTNGTPPPGFAGYLAAKSALLGLSRALAVEYAAQHILFNVISPGFTDTDLTNHVPEMLKQRMAAEIPSRRIGEAIDVAKAIVIMASRYTDYIVGGQLLVCGGSTIV